MEKKGFTFKEFCKVAEDIEKESGNLKIESLLSEMLKEAAEEDTEDLEVCSRFITGDMYPGWQTDKKIGMGPSLIYETISVFSDKNADEVENMVVEKGDAGIVAEELLENKVQSGLGSFSDINESNNLYMREVYDKLDEIATFSGSGSQDKKTKTLSEIMSDASPIEAKFICRLVLDEMRIGVGQGTVRKSISKAFDIDEDLIKRKIMYTNDLGKVARVAAEEGLEGIKDIDMEVGTPVKPMLAKKSTVDDVFDDIKGENNDVAVQYKYDGARLQIHKNGDNIKLYTRNSENKTEAFPEVVEQVKEKINKDNVILDSEVVAYYTDDKSKPAPFKEVSTRLQRKYDIEEKMEEIEMEVKVFDIIYNDKVLIDKSLKERLKILDSICPDIKTDTYYSSNKKEIKEIEDQSLDNGHEGIMAKSTDSIYRLGNRGKRWLKIKPKIETLDVVVTGGEWGEGRRSNMIGSYEISVRDKKDNLKKIGKVATGITDDKLEELTNKFQKYIKSENGKNIDFKPEVVFEVGYEEIQNSPKYESNYALRFPRLVTVREDKDVNESDTIKRVKHIKKKQS